MASLSRASLSAVRIWYDRQRVRPFRLSSHENCLQQRQQVPRHPHHRPDISRFASRYILHFG